MRPNAITTVVFLISLVGAFLTQTADPLLLAVGGVLFQLASILDGCDGEVSRLKFQGTRWGGWYDTVSDNVRLHGVLQPPSGSPPTGCPAPRIYLWALVPFLTPQHLLRRHHGRATRSPPRPTTPTWR